MKPSRTVSRPRPLRPGARSPARPGVGRTGSPRVHAGRCTAWAVVPDPASPQGPPDALLHERDGVPLDRPRGVRVRGLPFLRGGMSAAAPGARMASSHLRVSMVPPASGLFRPGRIRSSRSGDIPRRSARPGGARRPDVDRKMQRTIRSGTRSVDVQGRLASAEPADIGTSLIQIDQPQQALDDPCGLAQRHPEQRPHRQAGLERDITEIGLAARLAGRRCLPGHVGIEPDRRRATALPRPVSGRPRPGRQVVGFGALAKPGGHAGFTGWKPLVHRHRGTEDRNDRPQIPRLFIAARIIRLPRPVPTGSLRPTTEPQVSRCLAVASGLRWQGRRSHRHRAAFRHLCRVSACRQVRHRRSRRCCRTQARGQQR